VVLLAVRAGERSPGGSDAFASLYDQPPDCRRTLLPLPAAQAQFASYFRGGPPIWSMKRGLRNPLN
jgi:hypothetical protein